VTAPPAAGAPGAAGPRFVVTVGTDHHPFDRLIGWINDWLGQHPARIPAFFAQFGSASTEPLCAGSRFLDAGQLDQVLGDADVMICHGGPGSIADAWHRGQVPIVVPRLRRLGEVVDDHQVDFCVKLAALGRVRLAQDREVFAGLIDEATADLASFRVSGPGPDVDAAVARFGALVDELVSRPSRRLPLNARSRRARRGPETGDRLEVGAGDLPAGLAQAAHADSPPIKTSASTGLPGVPHEERI
jgi:UDP-N-acetylglucosamine transferase subunit ALG13